MAASAPPLASFTSPSIAPLAEQEKQRLRELAAQAAGNSYSPYSRFRAGAASMPCGACRQMLSEFGDDGTVILYLGEGGGPEETTLGALLPHAFRLQFVQEQ